jgi:translocator protein
MNNTALWYSKLIRPAWAPPSWVFGPVWSVLYVIIAVSYGYVFYGAYKGTIPMMVALPFILNLFFNLIYSPIQFRLQNNLLGAIDILLILGTLIWALIAIYPYAKWAAIVNAPYLLWVTFATTLQMTITWLNR